MTHEVRTDSNGSCVCLEEGVPAPFRYEVKPNTVCNTFEPRALSAEAERDMLRASMFGALFLDEGSSLKSCPCSDVVSILWEAGSLLSRETHLLQVQVDHARVTGLKPKLWITANVKIPAQCAVRLQ